MLVEILCTRFRAGALRFKPGLNVVLGDEEASNSIGKSSALMVVDFAFGGNSLLEDTPEIAQHLGPHKYDITFGFEGERFRWQRSTTNADIVLLCDQKWNIVASKTKTEYTAWLTQKYGLEHVGLRRAIAPFSRVWGKDNINPRRPLHVVQQQKPAECLDVLLRIARRYDTIENLLKDFKAAENRRKTLNAAFRDKLVPQITKKKFKENKARIEALEAEIEEIEHNIGRIAINLNEIANREFIELKVQKDLLLQRKAILDARLLRTDAALRQTASPLTKSFQRLAEVFPEVNLKRLEEVEQFHSGMRKIMNTELKTAKSEYTSQKAAVEAEITALNESLSKLLQRTDQPSLIVERVVALSTESQELRRENEFHEKRDKLATTRKGLEEQAKTARSDALAKVVAEINAKMLVIADQVFQQKGKSPVLSLSGSGYEFAFEADKGTGTTYAGLVIFDLAVMELYGLPMIIQDSVLFKNIERAGMVKLVEIYSAIESGQVFIAIDEALKFGGDIAETLSAAAAVRLSSSALLYDTDWRTGASTRGDIA